MPSILNLSLNIQFSPNYGKYVKLTYRSKWKIHQILLTGNMVIKNALRLQIALLHKHIKYLFFEFFATCGMGSEKNITLLLNFKMDGLHYTKLCSS